MKISDYHYIKSLSLPADWLEVVPGNGGINVETVRSFVPKGKPEVRIELYYRGLPVSKEAAEIFRHILKLAPKVIFDISNGEQLSKDDWQLLSDLEEILGNIGNNQIVNTQEGRRGAPFILERLEVSILNTKPVLAASGHFINPENKTRGSEFFGFFIDARPKDTSCSIEEIYLEAPQKDIQLFYLPAFQNCLSSLEWLSD